MNEPNQNTTRPSLKRFLTQHVTAVDITAAIIIVILVMGNVFFSLRYNLLEEEVFQNQQAIAANNVNNEVLDFAQLFIDDVLKAEQEIDFEKRLNLESAVRGLEDEDVLAAWQKFTSSATEREAQNAVKDLLSILISRVRT